MPIYAYRCQACDFAKDVLQKVSDPQLTVCLSCGQPTFKKQLTAAGFQLKGTGWYATDFRQSGGAPAQSGTESQAGGDTDAANKVGTDKEASDKGKSDQPASDKPASDKSTSEKSTGDKSVAGAPTASSTSASSAPVGKPTPPST